MHFGRWLVGGFALCFATSTYAREWPTTGGWSVSELSDRSGCSTGQDFEGPGNTFLAMTVYLDGHAAIMALNYNWSIRDGEHLSGIVTVVNGNSYSGGQPLGFQSDGRHGFGTEEPASFVDDFAAGGQINFTRDGTAIERLSLNGSGGAVATVRACVANIRRENDAAARAAAPFADIPRDPFANSH